MPVSPCTLALLCCSTAAVITLGALVMLCALAVGCVAVGYTSYVYMVDSFRTPAVRLVDDSDDKTATLVMCFVNPLAYVCAALALLVWAAPPPFLCQHCTCGRGFWKPDV